MSTVNKEGQSITDLEEQGATDSLAEFFVDKGIVNLQLLTSSHMNLTWEGTQTGQQVICQLGPNLGDYKYPKEMLGNYEYFNPYKYQKAQEICAVAQSHGVVCPSLIQSGFEVNGTRSWCIAEKCQDQNLESAWSQLDKQQKIQISSQIGANLGRLHSIDPVVMGLTPQDPKDWYETWLNKTTANLQATGVYSEKEVAEIMQLISQSKFYTDMLPPTLAIIHGDILQKNVFINAAHQVTAFIDWETSTLANPWADVILAAWWISDEYGGDEDIYQSVIVGYNEITKGSKLYLPISKAKEINPYVDLFWYLNILWARVVTGDPTQTERRKKMVSKILEEIKHG